MTLNSSNIPIESYLLIDVIICLILNNEDDRAQAFQIYLSLIGKLIRIFYYKFNTFPIKFTAFLIKCLKDTNETISYN